MRYLTKENGMYGIVQFLTKIILNTQSKMLFDQINMCVCKVM